VVPRARIDIPDAVALPAGRISITAIKAHYREHYARHVAIFDATMRAYLEAHLTTTGAGDLH